MGLEGLSVVLADLKRTRWQDQQLFEKFVQLWPEIVGTDVAAQTRPIRITPQDVLQVATSSGVWAQNLAFERLRILAKVNAVWSKPLKDIHFSAHQWHRSAPLRSHQGSEIDLTPKGRGALSQSPQARPKTAQEAFLRWSQAVQKQASRSTQRCPICHCSTPIDELERWGHCALCISRSNSL